MTQPPPQRFTLWTMLSTLSFVSLFCGICMFAFGPVIGRAVLAQVAVTLGLGGFVAAVVWGACWLLQKD